MIYFAGLASGGAKGRVGFSPALFFIQTHLWDWGAKFSFMIKKFQISLSVTLIILGLVFLKFSSFLGGVLILISGVVNLPFVSNYLNQKVTFWENRFIRFLILFILILSGIILNSLMLVNKPSKRQTRTIESRYNDYIKNSEIKIGQLPDKIRSKREDLLKELKSNETYKRIIDSGEIAMDNVNLLSTISYEVSNMYESGDNEIHFNLQKVTNATYKKVNQTDREFVNLTTTLSLPTYGGVPKQILLMFEDYVSNFGYYGKKGSFKSGSNGDIEIIQFEYNLSPFMIFVSPNDKDALMALYLSYHEGIHKFSKELNKQYLNGYFHVKSMFIEHIKENYPSCTCLGLNNDVNWNLYDSSVKDRIENYVFEKDCSGLQEEFNIADQNQELQIARTGNGNTELMIYLDDLREIIGCYN